MLKTGSAEGPEQARARRPKKRRPETAAAIERLNAEAAALLDGGAGSEKAAGRLAEIEAEIGTMTARLSLKQRAAADMETKAAREEAEAAEQERWHQTEAARRRREKTDNNYLEQA